jgi:hypothetical protein
MLYGNTLSFTGGAAALAVGHILGIDHVISAAMAIVLFGVAAYRYGSRIGKARTSVCTAALAAVFGVAYLADVVGGLAWPNAALSGLTVAMALLYVSSRILPARRQVVA